MLLRVMTKVFVGITLLAECHTDCIILRINTVRVGLGGTIKEFMCVQISYYRYRVGLLSAGRGCNEFRDIHVCPINRGWPFGCPGYM